MNRRQFLAAAGSIGAVAVAGCVSAPAVDGSGGTSDDGSGAAVPDDAVDMTGESTVRVDLRDGETDDEGQFVFDPEVIAVDVGTTVRWVNTHDVFHTVTSTASLENRTPSGEFDETLQATGDEFEYTFEEAGTQPYYCQPHASFMAGTVGIVE